MWTLPNAHTPIVRDVDHNPNKPWHLATCGDDRAVRIWDTRKHDAPLLTLREHSHWVWTVRFNGSHDLLLLSGSTDASVNIWLASSVSSTPAAEISVVENAADEEVADDERPVPSDRKITSIKQCAPCICISSSGL